VGSGEDFIFKNILKIFIGGNTRHLAIGKEARKFGVGLRAGIVGFLLKNPTPPECDLSTPQEAPPIESRVFVDFRDSVLTSNSNLIIV
jgi:hypothetical protein